MDGGRSNRGPGELSRLQLARGGEALSRCSRRRRGGRQRGVRRGGRTVPDGGAVGSAARFSPREPGRLHAAGPCSPTGPPCSPAACGPAAGQDKRVSRGTDRWTRRPSCTPGAPPPAPPPDKASPDGDRELGGAVRCERPTAYPDLQANNGSHPADGRLRAASGAAPRSTTSSWRGRRGGRADVTAGEEWAERRALLALGKFVSVHRRRNRGAHERTVGLLRSGRVHR